MTVRTSVEGKFWFSGEEEKNTTATPAVAMTTISRLTDAEAKLRRLWTRRHDWSVRRVHV